MGTIRVVVAEDSYLIREALRAVLRPHEDIELVASATSFEELLAAVELHRPQLLITDVRMPPNHDDEGVRAAELLAVARPEVGVVVLSQYVEPAWARRLFEPRASGRAYLLKEHVGDVEQLRSCLRTVLEGGTVLDPRVVEALLRSQRQVAESPLARLSERESEVLELVAAGLSNPAIAERLFLSVRAVEKHVSAVMAKLDLPADDTAIHRRVRAAALYLSAFSG
jgi:DNA-binding NarL/FixJ family response regulator